MNVTGSRVRALTVVFLAIASGLASALAQQIPPPPPPPPPPGVFAQNPQPPVEQPKGTGLILGQVIDSGTKRGISGATVTIDYDFASHVEFQKAVELFTRLEDRLTPPFITGENGTSEEIASREALLDRVLASAKKDLSIQRYKGLGEMNPEQLWETTMNPYTRTLLQVRIDDAVETDEIFTVLMGDSVEPRRKFIEDNALDVKNLDI